MPAWATKLRLAIGRSIVRRIGGLDLAKINPTPTRLNTFTKAIKRLIIDDVPLQNALLGPLSFQVIRTSVEIGLVQLLDERRGLTLQEVARELRLTEYAAQVLLIGMMALKVVVKAGGRYYADPFLSQMLLARTDAGFGPKYLAFVHHLVGPALTQLEASVRSGRPRGLQHLFGDQAASFYGELAGDERLNAYFEPVMRHLSGVNENRVACMKVWADRQRVLDVGGGAGGLAMAIARHHGGLTVTVVDFPAVASATAKNFSATPEACRLATVGADISEGALPAGHDCIVFSHFLDIFSEEKVLSYLGRAHDALPPGGRLCIFTPVIDDDETGPLPNALLCAYFLCLANGEGRFYSARQLTDQVRAAGFADVSLTRLPMNEVVIFAVKRGSLRARLDPL